MKATAASLGTLLTGGIGFDTPLDDLNTPPSSPGTEFPLHDDKASARAAAIGFRAYYTVEFPGSVQGLAVGAPVELQGLNIGRVSDVYLEYDPHMHTLKTPATLELQPKAVTGLMPQGQESPKAVMELAFSHLIEQGLRARLTGANLLTGQRSVSLEFVSNAPGARLLPGQLQMEIPSVSSGDLDDFSRSATEVANQISRLITSPEMMRSVKSLDETLANLDRVSRAASGQAGPLLVSLRKTADAAQATLVTANRAMGGQAAQDPNLPRLIDELTDAARSVRILADYLDEHPEALLRGRVAAQR